MSKPDDRHGQPSRRSHGGRVHREAHRKRENRRETHAGHVTRKQPEKDPSLGLDVGHDRAMSRPNRMTSSLARLNPLPGPVRRWASTFALGQVVPMVGVAGLTFEELTPERVVVSVKNRRRVRNHIGGVHAAAMALLAETATGFCVGMSVPDDKLPVIKSMKVDYLKRATGGLRAVAKLTPQQIERVRTLDKGEVNVAVTITDDSGRSPIEAEMIWAWIPKKRG